MNNNEEYLTTMARTIGKSILFEPPFLEDALKNKAFQEQVGKLRKLN